MNRLPLVLVQNEVTVDKRYEEWQDETGERYHFPNTYKNLIVPGRAFVYYRGVRRSNHSRAIPEYFGCGRIAAVERDPSVPPDRPKRDWKWFASITGYVPFARPVPFRINGSALENLRNRSWGRPRTISQEIYELILDLSGTDEPQPIAINSAAPILVDLKTITMSELNVAGASLLVQPKAAAGSSPWKRGGSRTSKVIGRRAEQVALEFLRNCLAPKVATTLRWVADEGLTPGWDIEYTDEYGLTAVEVKGTTSEAFDSLEITANEIGAAKALGERYVLLLVARCLSNNPILERIVNPAILIEKAELEIQPIAFRIRRVARAAAAVSSAV